MFALVLYDDGVYYICQKKDITGKGVKCSIRYRDGNRYAGKVIAYDDKKEQLVFRKNELEKKSSDSEDGEQNKISKENGLQNNQMKRNKMNIRGNVEKKPVTKKLKNKTSLQSNERAHKQPTKIDIAEEKDSMHDPTSPIEANGINAKEIVEKCSIEPKEHKSDVDGFTEKEDTGNSKDDQIISTPDEYDLSRSTAKISNNEKGRISKTPERDLKEIIGVQEKTAVQSEINDTVAKNESEHGSFSVEKENTIGTQDEMETQFFAKNKPVQQECLGKFEEENMNPIDGCYSPHSLKDENLLVDAVQSASRDGKIKIVCIERVIEPYDIQSLTKSAVDKDENKTNLSQSTASNLCNSKNVVTDFTSNSPKLLDCENELNLKNASSNSLQISNEALKNNIMWDWDQLNLSVYNAIPGAQSDIPDLITFLPTDFDISNESLLKCKEFPNTVDVKDSSSNIHEHQTLEVEPNTFDDNRSLRISDTKVILDVANDAANSDNVSDDDCNSTGSSYQPSSNNSDDSADSEAEQSTQKNHSNSKQDTLKSCNASTDLEASLLINKAGHSAPDDTKMTIRTVEEGKKKDWCVYCDTEQAKLSRHVVRKHRNNEDVAKFLSFEVGSAERKIVMDRIRKLGQFRFNTNRAVNTGERRVKRRPNARYGKKATDFATCPSCLGDYAKTSLRHHFRRCSKKKSGKHRSILKSSKQLTGRIHHKACDVLRARVFPTMQEDDVATNIRYDELVILFGNKLCQKYKDPHFYDMIRQKLRQLGRFLLELRTHDSSIVELFDVFYPKNYDVTISAIQSLAGLNSSGTGFKVPSLATSLGTLIKQVGKLCVSIWIKRQDKQKQMYAEDFLKLLTEDYATNVARTALESQARQKRRTKVMLPSKSDINKLQTYLRDRLREYYKNLSVKVSREKWLRLSEVVLISIQLFNRRRAGEIERILIEDYANHEMIDEKTIGEAFHKLSVEEKQAANKYVRFTIRGKLNRTVPVLLHREVLVCIQLLLKHRIEIGVHTKNPYVFGIPGLLKGDYKYLRACELMRRFSKECGAENPSTLRGTILRKHVATMCINFNLTDGEVSDLANFLGHADKIHRDHYRQPIITKEILQISKLLEAVQGPDDNSEEESENDETEPNALQAACSKELDFSTTLDPPTGNDSTCCNDVSDDDMFVQPKAKKQAKKRSTSPYGKCSRVRWSADETKVAQEAFKSYIRSSGKLPSFAVIEKVVEANPGVFKRNVASIKSWVSNQIKKAKKL